MQTPRPPLRTGDAPATRTLSRLPGGDADGPTLLVATGPGLHDALLHRLSAPGETARSGTILLMRLSQVEDDLDDAGIDDIVSLPQSASCAASIGAAFETVLRKARAMGMFDAPAAPAAPDAAVAPSLFRQAVA